MGQKITVAAANTPAEAAKNADFICTGKNDELLINQAIAMLTRGGTIQLLDGDYYIDSFPGEGNSAIFFGYNDGVARTINFIGDTENKSYNTRFGVTIHVTKTAMDQIPADAEESFRVFFGTRKQPEAPGVFFTMTHINNVNFNNFYVYFYDASKPLIGIDASGFGGSYVKQVGVYTEEYFNDRFLHRKPKTPCKGTVGFVSCHGSNDEMARIGYDTANSGGLYIGFRLHCDKLIMKTCAGCRCCYAFHIGGTAKTLTMINCADEGNTHLPFFSAAPTVFHNPGGGNRQLTCIDYNIERFNEAYIPDDPEGAGSPFATEEHPGDWGGYISYTLQGRAFGINHFWSDGHGRNVVTVNQKNLRLKRSESPEYLETFFDVETNKTLTWNGSNWVDAMGSIVP